MISLLNATYGPPCLQVEFLEPCSLLQRIRFHGHAVAKMDILASGASTINTASTSHLHCCAYRTPVICQAIYGPSRKYHGLQIGAANLTPW